MNQLRRAFLQRAGLAGAALFAISAGLLKPGTALAAAWNKLAFNATNLAEAMKQANYSGGVQSNDIVVKAPDIAENGGSVPVEVICTIPGITAIAIFAEKNQTPLIADFELSNGAEAYISTRIKMSQTALVRIAVRAGGKVYTQTKEVKVTLGGCGG